MDQPPFQLLQLDHVVLRVRDVPTMVRFYRDVLGCRVERVQEAIGLTQETPQTTVDYTAYMKELEEVRRRGAAMTISQTILGVSGLSLPVLDANNRALAVVSISGPSARWTLAQMEAVVDECKRRAQLIARELGLHDERVDPAGEPS